MPRTKYPLLKCLHRGEKGFTLIELLVVISILGVIAAVAIPNITKFMGSGKSEAAKTELANVQTAVTAYMYDNEGALPAADPVTGGIITILIDDYIIGGLAACEFGVYSVADDGEVTTTYVAD